MENEMIFKTLDRKGTMREGGSLREWCAYDRLRKAKCRQYHFFSVTRVVHRTGAYYKLIVGPLVWAWGFKENKGAMQCKN